MPWEQRRRPASEYLHPAKAARILAAHHGICHLCGQPGATEVDHVIPWSQWTDPLLSVHGRTNLAPAHQSCHAAKTKAEAAAGRAAALASRQAQARRPADTHPGVITYSDCTQSGITGIGAPTPPPPRAERDAV